MTLVFRNKDVPQKILKQILKYVVIVVAIYFAYQYQYHKTLQYRYEYLKSSVVKVVNLQYNLDAINLLNTGNFYIPHSLGTGTFVNKHYILTASHVVEGAAGLNVELNGKTYTAELVYNSPVRDYAVLYVKDYEGVPVPLGDSSILKVGDAVLILGNPLGILYTLGYGFVSAPNQDIEGTATFYIQSWTQANPGNSGGALFNDDNEVVRHANNNFDFSVPINEIKEKVYKVIKEHKLSVGK